MLLASTHKEDPNESDKDRDEDVACLPKKFNRLLKNKKNSSKNFEDTKNFLLKKNFIGSSIKKDVQCFNCKCFEHITAKCPTPKEQE